MRTELRIHRHLIGALATLLVASVLILLYSILDIDAEDFEANLSVMVIFASGTILACMGIAEALTAIQFGPNHKRELLGYSIVGIGSLGCALYLGAASAASLDLVAVLISFHIILFGTAELRIAQHLRHHMKVRRLLRTGGCSVTFCQTLAPHAPVQSVSLRPATSIQSGSSPRYSNPCTAPRQTPLEKASPIL